MIQRSGAFRVLVVGSMLMLLASPSGAEPTSLEQAVKASYILKLAPFIEWPAAAFQGTSAAFTICIAGQDPFGTLIDDVVRGQKVRGRAILLRRLSASAPTAGCHMLFIGRSAMAITPVAGQPVLTISDAGYGAPDSMIRFVMQGSRVRFQIDDDTARSSGIVVSSKLLSLSVGATRR